MNWRDVPPIQISYLMTKDLEKLRKICPEVEKVKNFDKAVNDPEITWELHHLLGEKKSRRQLKVEDKYYNRPPEEFEFLPPDEHRRRHHSGTNNANYGKFGASHPKFGHHHSEDTKRRQSKSHIESGHCVFVCPIRLLYLRNIKKLTLSELAKEFNTSRPTIGKKLRQLKI